MWHLRHIHVAFRWTLLAIGRGLETSASWAARPALLRDVRLIVDLVAVERQPLEQKGHLLKLIIYFVNTIGSILATLIVHFLVLGLNRSFLIQLIEPIPGILKIRILNHSKILPHSFYTTTHSHSLPFQSHHIRTPRLQPLHLCQHRLLWACHQIIGTIIWFLIKVLSGLIKRSHAPHLIHSSKLKVLPINSCLIRLERRLAANLSVRTLKPNIFLISWTKSMSPCVMGLTAHLGNSCRICVA